MNKIRSLFNTARQSFFWSVIVIPLVVAIPPTVLGLASQFDTLKTFFDANTTITLICAFWVPLIVIPGAILRRLFSDSLSTQQLTYLVNLLAGSIGKKIERMHSFLTHVESNKVEISNQKIIEVLNPKLQMVDIMANLWCMFHPLSPSKVKVSLAKMGQNHIEEFVCWHPGDVRPRNTVQKLQHEECTFSVARRTKEIVVIEDVAKESAKQAGQRFHRTNGAQGSIIAYPVIDRGTDEVPYVLSVCAAEPNSLLEKNKAVYEFLLEQFAQRVVMEYHFEEITKLIK